ncbi:hypothetical protein [Cyanobium sp. NIES-981]|uniref:hypothetical protein n=1 Tax=Cyanobium sp. NIES-981 TaxID=1851505 RepID=UPI0007DD2017|nr:hypothetical protein [Cyanobium sp. NIES-981]SBO42649.1 protein of unknown function [Cyanobium sp. NIES-981]
MADFGWLVEPGDEDKWGPQELQATFITPFKLDFRHEALYSADVEITLISKGVAQAELLKTYSKLNLWDVRTYHANFYNPFVAALEVKIQVYSWSFFQRHLFSTETVPATSGSICRKIWGTVFSRHYGAC